MKKLEKKILDRVYSFETKKTFSEIVVQALSILLTSGLAIWFGFSVYRQMQEQQTLDLLEIFQEDIDTVKTYLGDVVSTFYQETPKQELIIVIIGMFLVFIFGLIFVKNFAKIRKKIAAILKFYEK